MESERPLDSVNGLQSLIPHGKVLRRNMRSNPGQEYLLYVPKSGAFNAPVFVAVHGLSRNLHEQTEVFAPLCEKYGVVMIAPQFTTEGYKDYQRLGRVGRGGRADVFLNGCLTEVASLTSADVSKVYLFGFSGGAQFCHRYLMAHPQRVARAVIAAAGWYTFPDTRVKFPYGIRPTRKLPGVIFDPEEFLRVPVRVLVGDRDVSSTNLRSNDKLNEQQGKNRVQRARKWVATMRAAAEAYGIEPSVTYTEVPETDHTFTQFCQRAGLAERIFGSLFGASDHVPQSSDHPMRMLADGEGAGGAYLSGGEPGGN